MALEAGAVYTRVGARLDDSGFDRFDRRVRQARATAAKPIEATGHLRTDEASVRRWEQEVRGARREAVRPITTRADVKTDFSGLEAYKSKVRQTRTEARRPIKQETKVDVDERGFARFRTAATGARTEGIKFGTAIAGSAMGTRAALLGLQGGATAAGAAVVGIVYAGARFEKAMNAVRAVTGANRQQMKALSDAALNLGTSTGVGASKAAEAIVELAKGGLDPATIAAGGLKGALALAQAGSLDMADAATVTANALNLFHLRGADATHVADAFATAANATTADVSDFALALSQGGSAAKSAGLSFDQTTAALEVLAANGIKGSDAGTSLKTALVQIAAPTKQAKDEMHKLGLNFFDAHGKMKSLHDISVMLRDKLGGLTRQQRLAAVQTIAGTDGMRTLLGLYDIGPRRVDGFTRGLKQHGSAAKQAAIQNAGLAGAGRKVLAALEGLGIRLSRGLNPALTKAGLAFAGFLRNLSRGDKATGDVGKAIRGIHRVIEQLAPVFKVVGGAIRIALEAWVKYVGMALKGISGIIGGIARVFRGVGRVISGIVHGDFKKVFSGLRDIVSGGLKTIVGLIRLGTAPFRAAFAAIFRGIARISSSAFGGVVGAVKSGIRFIAGGASTLLGILAKIADGASHLPFVGGKFRGLARDLRALQRQVDRYRDSLKDLRPEERRQVRQIETHADRVNALRLRLRTLRAGTGDYRETAQRLRAEQGKLNTSLRNASPAARRAARGLGTVLTAAHSASGTVGDAADAIARNVNDLAKSLQSKGIHFRVAKTPAARRSQAVVFGGADPINTELNRAQGGWIGQAGARGMDTVRLAPPPGSVVLTGRQAAALGIPQTGANTLTAGFSTANGVPVMAGRGEYLALPHEVPGLARAAAATPYGSLDGLFASLPIPHYMARGGMVRVPGDPNDTGGRDRVNASVVDKVSAWVRRYRANIGYAFDPGGGHKSPGHNVTGTATDVYPGPGGSWDLLEAGLRVLARAGYTIYYGTHGIGTPLAGHGRGNHAHIEWGSASGGVADVQLPHRKVIGPDGVLKRIIQATIDRGEKAGNAYLSSLMGTGDAGMPGGGVFSPQQLAKLWIAAGGPPGIAGLMARVAMAESGGNPNAHNPSGATGLWQILGAILPGNLRNPMVNARNAVAKYRSQGLGAWAASRSVWGRSRGGWVQRLARGGHVRTVHGFNRAELGLPKNASKAAMERAYRTGHGTVHGFHARDLGLHRNATHAQILKRLNAGRATVHGFHARDLDLPRSATRETMLNRYRDLSSLGLIHYQHPVNPNAPQYQGPGGYQLLQHDLDARGRLLVDPADPESTRIHNAWVRAGQNLTIADADLNTTDDNSIAAAGYLDFTNRQRLAYWRRRVAYWQRQLRKRLSKSARKIGQARFEQALANLSQSTQDATSSHSDYVDRLSNRFPAPDDTGAGTGGETPASPAQIAEAAAAQFASFNAARSDLFVNFGRNFATATRDPFATELDQAAGLAAFGGGTPADTGPISDPRRNLVGSRSAGGVTQHVYVTLNSPGETHTMTRSLFHEALGA